MMSIYLRMIYLKNKLTKKILLFLLIEIIITGITFPFYLFYGPFHKVRDMIVGISMSTGNHQYIAKLFFSDEEIQEILNNEEEQLNNEEATFTMGSAEVETNNNDIERININTNKFDGIALIIKDPKRVKVGYSSKLGKVGETVSVIAERYGAIAAINGGGYSDVSPNGNSGGTGGKPLGILISNGKVLNSNSSDNNDKVSSTFGIDENGIMFVGSASVNELINMGIKEAISFSPTLIVNGEPSISETTLFGINPRTAIGQKADGSIILLVIDGRQGLKLGANLSEVQEIMIKLGAINAICLDGGGSSAMYYEGEIINNPSCVTGERYIPDIIYVMEQEN